MQLVRILVSGMEWFCVCDRYYWCLSIWWKILVGLSLVCSLQGIVCMMGLNMCVSYLCVYIFLFVYCLVDWVWNLFRLLRSCLVWFFLMLRFVRWMRCCWWCLVFMIFGWILIRVLFVVVDMDILLMLNFRVLRCLMCFVICQVLVEEKDFWVVSFVYSEWYDEMMLFVMVMVFILCLSCLLVVRFMIFLVMFVWVRFRLQVCCLLVRFFLCSLLVFVLMRYVVKVFVLWWKSVLDRDMLFQQNLMLCRCMSSRVSVFMSWVVVLGCSMWVNRV